MWRREEPLTGLGRLVAHRAGAALAGGDPLAGVRKLIELGVEMVEFDVRSTADGTLVVNHDDHVGGRRLADQGYGDLARTGAPPPRLADFLAVVDGRLALAVELKEPGYEHRVVDAVIAAAPADKVVFTSFEDGVVAAVTKLGAGVGVGLLLGRRRGLATPLAVLRDSFPFSRMESVRADFLAPSRALLATGLRRRAARRGIGLLVWTVDDDREVQRLRAAPGVLGVVTDSLEALSAGRA